MGKASIDDGLCEHPKFLAVGAEAGWLWLAGLLYARRTLSDGFIPKVKVPSLVLGQRGASRLAGKLVEVGLWQITTGGYLVHDFLDHNPTREQVQKYQAKDRARKQTKYAKAHGLDSHEDSEVETTSDSKMDSAADSVMDSDGDSVSTCARTKSESAYESESEPSPGSAEKSARETTPINGLSPYQPRSSHASALVGRHHLHPEGTLAACERGVCVPGFVYQEWRQQFGAESATAVDTIRAFVERVIAASPPGPIGDDPAKFWRAHWRAEHGSQAPIPPSMATKGNASVAAGLRVLARRATKP